METSEPFDPVLDPETTLTIGVPTDPQLELNLGLPDSARRLANAIGVTQRVMRGEVVLLSEVSSKTHGAETVVLVGRALRGRMTAI